MTNRISAASAIGVLAAVLLLSACGSRPVLLAKPAGVPEGVDLSGHWTVRQTSRRQQLPTEQGVDIRSTSRSQRSRRSGSKRDSSVHVFMRHGASLKISQTPYGLFISYDRAVVEEYTFGEHRTVSIGPIEAMRVSGWEAGRFVVETMDEGGTTLTESWRLESNDVLVRQIRVGKKDREILNTSEVFDRS